MSKYLTFISGLLVLIHIYKNEESSLLPTPASECSKCHYGKCLKGECYCLEGYWGKYCDRSLDPFFLACLVDKNHPDCKYHPKPHFNPDDKSYCPYNCSERGVCLEGECECEEGFQGTFCEKKICVNNCNGNGNCQPDNTCKCNSGFGGKFCEKKVCNPECEEYGGYCNNGLCYCPGDRYGTSCEYKTCPAMCSSNGYCKNGKCECLPDWTGADCSQRACFKNCHGHGHCTSDFFCKCYNGFKGKYCEEIDCICDHGICKFDEQKNKIKCECVKGYSGVYCDQRLCPANCNQKGICLDGSCKCNDGYYGLSCEKHKCQFDCWHRGSCKDQKCTCFEGYLGDYCEKSQCLENCNNNGNCVDRKCQCFASYYGDSCQYVNCPVKCGITGECAVKARNEFVCSCKPGWGGEDCTQKVEL